MAPINLWRGFAFDNPAQIAFLRSPAKYRLLSSGRGGGKSVVGCRESIRCAIEFPGSRNMICRLKSTELDRTTHQTFKRQLREIGLKKDQHYSFNSNERTYTWFNGSQTVFSHMEDEEKFGSEEMSTIFVDEGSQVKDSIYQMLFPANLRWPVGPHRAWFCTNPGASGWLEDITDKSAKGSGRQTQYQKADGEMEVVEDHFAWFPVLPGWNKHNPGGQAYFDDLLRDGTRYGQHWLDTYYHGKWGAMKGMRFPMFEHEKHVMSSPFRPDPHHEVIEGYDFGQHTHVVWIAFDPRGIEPVVVFDELEFEEVGQPYDVARRVMDKRKEYGINRPGRVLAYGDPRSAVSTQFSAVTPFAAYGALGIDIAPAKGARDPIDRANLLAARLSESKVQPGGEIWPGIVFGPNCRATVRSITRLRYDTDTNSKGEAPREHFIDTDKHGFDSCTYGLYGVPPPLLEEAPHGFRPGVNVDAKTAWSMAG